MSAALVLIASLSSILFSCMEDPGTHLSQFYYPTSQSHPYYLGYMPVYADQPTDSIFFATTEQWKLKLEYFGSSEGWLTISPELVAPDFNIQENSIYYLAGPVKFAPNTTGNKRRVRIDLDAGKYDCSCGFIQLPYLSISRPYRYVISTATETSLTSRDSLSTLLAGATTVLDSICFRTYADWELTAKDGSWLTPQTTSGGAGSNVVRLTIQPNTQTTCRTETLYLSTKGVDNTTDKFIVDTITITQLGVDI